MDKQTQTYGGKSLEELNQAFEIAWAHCLNTSKDEDSPLSQQAIRAGLEAVAKAVAEGKDEESEKVKRVPGMWKCRTCGFVQTRSTIRPNGIFADTKPLEEPCPNEGDVMFPVYWADLAKENQDFYFKEKNKFDAEITKLREVARELLKALLVAGNRAQFNKGLSEDDCDLLNSATELAQASGLTGREKNEAIKKMRGDRGEPW